MAGLHKDHKSGWLQEKGPPLRPLCNGNIGANASVAAVTSLLLRPLKRDAAREQGTSITSTEELKHHLGEANRRLKAYVEERAPSRPQRMCKAAGIQSGTVFVGSMDVKSLYPNCKLREASQHVKDTARLGLTSYCNVDYKKLSKYLALTVGKTNSNLDKYLPTPKGTTTLHSFTRRDTPGQFWDAELDPSLMTDGERKMMVAWGICQGLAVTYQNHYYTAAGVIHRQEDGGPQGVCTAVEASEIYMLAFNRKYLVKLVKLGITLVLYERYVEDITVSGCSLKPG